MFQKLLSKWFILVEEGHRFQDSPFLKSLLAEARKHIRKLIVVSHQPEPFKGLAIVYKVRSARAKLALYTFKVKATDGDLTGDQPEHFAIKIWEGTDTEADLIHNYKGDLAGGNIIVHKK